MGPKVTLFTLSVAPNPAKVVILLEELGIEYRIVPKEVGNGPNGVKNDDFLRVTPNGRVPALIDHTNEDFIVWESGAILLYVAERFDTTGSFIGKTLKERAEVWQWLMFQLSGIGPMQGQHYFFRKSNQVKVDQSVYDRYLNETYRIYGVLEKQLETHEWIGLDRFTIADMANYPWLWLADLCDIERSKFPKVEAYFRRIKSLPSVIRAYEKLGAKTE
ncbi:hypothetical protein M422DRAFT_30595 [Sphaerobolus stellatus SS14]|uniref:Glutathione transferase n=1 Tax=Sphaerobolus stellatus (strain SS14) TaxID=990650 RepID=A0A0C9VZQ8_SPHS4|nr:hypothetical protein M422DRAFT_30595 [Sphaerobolus stellatus SS14]